MFDVEDVDIDENEEDDFDDVDKNDKNGTEAFLVTANVARTKDLWGVLLHVR